MIGVVMMIEEKDLELYHHGILGMRWGVRNAETRARYSSKKDKKRLMYEKSAKEVYKNRRTLSNKQLQIAAKRLKAEDDIRKYSMNEQQYGERYIKKSTDVLQKSLAIAATAGGLAVTITKLYPYLSKAMNKKV